MAEQGKSRLSAYIGGAVGGAVIVLIAGFSFGMLNTNSAVTSAVELAVVEQQAMFCAERARADRGYVDATTFAALATTAKRDFATQFATFEGQTTADGRAVVNACRSLLEAA